MSADQAIGVLDAFEAYDVEAIVGGGWGVDALLGRQTRPHADLDVWLVASTFERAVAGLVAAGVDRLFSWGDERPWNFVLHDGATRRVDLHLYEMLADGSVHYGGVASGDTFPSEALAGRGAIGDRLVRCESPEWSLKWHTGYPPRSVDRLDMALLCDRFGLGLPPSLASTSDGAS